MLDLCRSDQVMDAGVGFTAIGCFNCLVFTFIKLDNVLDEIVFDVGAQSMMIELAPSHTWGLDTFPGLVTYFYLFSTARHARDILQSGRGCIN